MKKKELFRNPSVDLSKDSSIQKKVFAIGEKVRTHGDKAILEFTKLWDNISLTSIKVTKQDAMLAVKKTPRQLQQAMRHAKKNITSYHRHQAKYLTSSSIQTSEGILCYRKFSPIERVGIYIPGGSAPLFSSALMTIIPARIAGCKEIVLCSPPQKDGKISSSILFAATLCGATEIYAVGGAQAIFAMAYGTKTIKPVLKIVGPGNDFVNEAKKQISSFLPIDMPAGPSEVMVIADSSQHPEIICTDLLSQLEHDPSSKAIFIGLERTLIAQVKAILPHFVRVSKRKAILQQSINNLNIYYTPHPEQAIQWANDYAPEHLIIATTKSRQLAQKVTNAGSVFIGKYSAESIGDYASGTNHTLPTQGYAKNYSGLAVESFGKWISFQEISKKGFHRIAKTVKVMSQFESLFEHCNAIIQREKLL